MTRNTIRRSTWLNLIFLVAGAKAIAENNGELKPGDFSYPGVISKPNLVIPLILSEPDWVGMQLVANYVSDANLFCGHEILGAGRYPYWVSVPINMTRAGDEYRGDVVIDRFKPGHCHWRFVDVGYGGWAEGIWNSLAVFAESGGLPAVPGPRIEFWCYRVTYEQKSVRNCEELAFLRQSNAMRAVSPEFLSKFTAEEKGHMHTIRVTTQTKEIRINLHDLNALQGALIPVGDSQAQIARSKADQAAMAETAEYKALLCVQPALADYVRSHQPLPDGPTQVAAIKALKQKCRADFGLPPADFEE
jgi:hypothetical protein